MRWSCTHSCRALPRSDGPETPEHVVGDVADRFACMSESAWDRVRQQGKKLGRPKVSPKVENAIRTHLSADMSILKVAALVGCGIGTVQRVKKEMEGARASAVWSHTTGMAADRQAASTASIRWTTCPRPRASGITNTFASQGVRAGRSSKSWTTRLAVPIGSPSTSRTKDSLGNKCPTWCNGRFHIVMPTQSLPQAKAGVGIHVFSLCWQQRRGWPAFAGHDEVARARPEMIWLFPLGS